MNNGFKGMLLYGFILLLVVAVLVVVFVCTQDAAAEEGVYLPVLMYHDVCDNPAFVDDYTVTLEQLAADIDALLARGFTPVTLTAVMQYAQAQGELPQNPVLIVFDDGYRSFYTRVFPLLQAKGVPAVVSVIGRQAQAAQAYAEDTGEFMSWDMLREVAASGLVELQSHSSGLHVYKCRPGVTRLSCESDAAYTQMLVEDVQHMHALAQTAQVTLLPAFAYPYGRLEPLAEQVLRAQGVQVTMTSEEHVNVITRSPESLYLLGRLNRSGKMSTEDVLLFMERAM